MYYSPLFAALTSKHQVLSGPASLELYVAKSLESARGLNSFTMETLSSRCHMGNFFGKAFIVKSWRKSGTLSLATPQGMA